MYIFKSFIIKLIKQIGYFFRLKKICGISLEREKKKTLVFLLWLNFCMEVMRNQNTEVLKCGSLVLKITGMFLQLMKKYDRLFLESVTIILYCCDSSF